MVDSPGYVVGYLELTLIGLQAMRALFYGPGLELSTNESLLRNQPSYSGFLLRGHRQRHRITYAYTSAVTDALEVLTLTANMSSGDNMLDTAAVTGRERLAPTLHLHGPTTANLLPPENCSATHRGLLFQCGLRYGAIAAPQ